MDANKLNQLIDNAILIVWLFSWYGVIWWREYAPELFMTGLLTLVLGMALHHEKIKDTNIRR